MNGQGQSESDAGAFSPAQAFGEPASIAAQTACAFPVHGTPTKARIVPARASSPHSGYAPGKVRQAPSSHAAYVIPIAVSDKTPFYKRTWLLVLLAIVCPVVGIPLMWVFGKPRSEAARIVVTVLGSLLFFVLLSGVGRGMSLGAYMECDPQLPALEAPSTENGDPTYICNG